MKLASEASQKNLPFLTSKIYEKKAKLEHLVSPKVGGGGGGGAQSHLCPPVPPSPTPLINI